jgi:hypothetical protein
LEKRVDVAGEDEVAVAVAVARTGRRRRVEGSFPIVTLVMVVGVGLWKAGGVAIAG